MVVLWTVPTILAALYWLNQFFFKETFFKINNIFYIVKEYLFIFLSIWIIFFLLQAFLFININNSFILDVNNTGLFYKNWSIFTFTYLNQISGFYFFYENNFYFTFNSLTIVFLLMICFSYPLSFLILDHRINVTNLKFFFYSVYLFCIIITFFLIENIFMFLILYEMILIPTFLLMYNLGSSRQCIEGAMYFFIWAHIGSVFIFLGIIYLSVKTSSYTFKDLASYNYTFLEKFILFWLFYVGFGCKIPLWPFYYWLPKAHVEAPTGLSVFLSGILVKVAFFGYFKTTELLGSNIPVNLATILPILGVLDGSIKMFYQTDLKRIIALATVVHMNYIVYSSLLGFTMLLKGGLLLLINHCFSATALFFSADTIYRRHQTRLSYEISGVFHYNPWVFTLVFFALLINFNFPGTLGFLGELVVGASSFYTWPVTTLIIHFFLFFVSVINFAKPWLDVFFGYPNIFKKNNPILDATRKEFFFIGLPSLYSFYLGFCPNIFNILFLEYNNALLFV